MDTGLSVRTATGIAYVPERATVAFAASASASVETELPPAKAVTASGGSQASASASNGRQATIAGGTEATRSAVVRSVIFDDKAQELVYRNLDKASGAVISQFPDEVTLSQKAYSRELLREDETRAAQADILA